MPSSTSCSRCGRSSAPRKLEGDAGRADARLGAHQPLAQRGRRDEEGAGDARGVQPEHRLQHQRRARRRVDRRMRADEEQAQPLVGQRRAAGASTPTSSASERRVCAALVLHAAVAPGDRAVRRRAAVSSQASGCAGTPSTGQRSSARAKASASASSARGDVACARREDGDAAGRTTGARAFRGRARCAAARRRRHAAFRRAAARPGAPRRRRWPRRARAPPIRARCRGRPRR